MTRVVIIGGGVIGVSIAWHLARKGAGVTVLERARVGGEASWAAAGMIAPQAEAQAAGPFFDLCIRARDGFEQTLNILRADTDVDPEYDRTGILYLALSDAERDELLARANWQVKSGGVVEELSGAAARKLEPAISPKTVAALYMPLERRVDNRKLTRAYAVAAAARGVLFVEGASVAETLSQGTSITGVRTHDGRLFEADVFVNAAGAWSGNIPGSGNALQTYPVRGQMICFENLPGTLKASIFSTLGYLVPRRDGRIIAGSTMEEAGFDKSVTLAGLAKISRGANEMLPGAGALAFREAWAGLRPATRDFMPVLGTSTSRQNWVYATGHFRSGILLSALTGEIIADLILGRKPSIDISPFSPARFDQPRNIGALALVRDILFRSRIDAAAQALGVDVSYAADLEQAGRRCGEIAPRIIFIDLSDVNFPLDRIAEKTGAAAPAAQLVGFASHVDLKTLAAAREMGFALVLSRSEFTARLPELLRK